MSGIVAGLGTLFAPAGAAGAGMAAGIAGKAVMAGAGMAAAAGAGGVAAAGMAGSGMGLFGSVLTGVGQAMFQRAQLKEEEQQQVRAERRREARYEGTGDAVRFWDRGPEDQSVSRGPDYQRVDPAEPMARRNLTNPQAQAGERFRVQRQGQSGQAGGAHSRNRYNPRTGRIEKQ